MWVAGIPDPTGLASTYQGMVPLAPSASDADPSAFQYRP